MLSSLGPAAEKLYEEARRVSPDFTPLAKGGEFRPGQHECVCFAPAIVGQLLARKKELKAASHGLGEQEKKRSAQVQSLLHHLAEHELLDFIEKQEMGELILCKAGQLVRPISN
ncbi:MAG: hypothetical protein V4480_02050 [Patescibacteria group bacterium]